MRDGGSEPERWRTAMAEALYGPGGFFVTGAGPAAHFRTSVHASPLFAGAMLRLIRMVDDAMGHPAALDLVDVGAGRGELLRALLALAPAELAARLRPLAVEKAPRPVDLPAGIGWADAVPPAVAGVLIATEWLDNVPLDVACPGSDGVPRYVLVDPATGRETAGGPVDRADADWLARWWPLSHDADPQGAVDCRDATGGAEPDWPRAEIGRHRDRAWAAAVSSVTRGLAVTVDYGHLLDGRPLDGTLTGFRAGRQVAPVPDGSCDLTAHVAMDSVAAAGGHPYLMVSQRQALRALGVDGARPPLALASTDPAGYLRALSTASAAGELTNPAGLGRHLWLLHPRRVDLDPLTGSAGAGIRKT